MKADVFVHPLHPRHEFRTSRGAGSVATNVFLRLEADGVIGWGEASPISYYNQSAESVRAKLLEAHAWISALHFDSPQDIARIWENSWEHLAPSRAAQCALDLALWDCLGRKNGLSVSELVWGKAPVSVKSFCTIGLSSEEELETKIAELRTNPLIKIKSDKQAELDVIDRVMRSCTGHISVDANCAWERPVLQALLPQLRARGILFVEQPLAPGEDRDLAPTVPPLFADETCVTEADVDRLPTCYSGFNIKLVKCGGLTPALRMVHRARELGLEVMIGCMLESSLAISAAAVIAQKTHFADLDGAWLLKDDPFEGSSFENGTFTSSPAPGFGVTPLLW